MKKFTIALVVLSLVVMGASLAMAKELPQAMKGMDLAKVKKVTDKEAQKVKGSGTCDPKLINYDYNNSYLYLAPGPHK